MLFIFSFSRYSNFCLDILVIQNKRRDQKDEVNFKFFDLTTWLTITIHILPNISRSKGNQTLKFGQVIEYITREIFFFKNYTENVAGRLVLDLFLFFKKALYAVKPNGLQLSFNHFPQSSTWQTIETKYIQLQNIDPEIYSILTFQTRVW